MKTSRFHCHKTTIHKHQTPTAWPHFLALAQRVANGQKSTTVALRSGLCCLLERAACAYWSSKQTAAWNLPLLIAGQNVQTAFDSMPHALIWDSMLARGVSTQVAALHLRELSGMEAYITLPMAGRTAAPPFTKDGKQDGIEMSNA